VTGAEAVTWGTADEVVDEADFTVPTAGLLPATVRMVAD
jgi:hypothetical protein